MKKNCFKTAVFMTLVLIGTAPLTFAAGAKRSPEPFYPGLGTYKRAVTTSSKKAERYFNQGLAFLFGFNHGAAIRSFQEATRLDPSFAMAHWGIAFACGPHINFPLVLPPAAELAWKEVVLAQANTENLLSVERDLIEALSTRYANPQPENRASLDQAYADAMRKVWQAHPTDPDVGAFFAEALMNLRPWDQWTSDGQEQPGTKEVVATLEEVLVLNKNHPFANHLYIHAVEASSHPEWADETANRLRTLQPGLAHNVHMPSHIDIRRGRWHQAVHTNLKAVKADKRYRKIAGPPQGFLLVYSAHNEHMLAYAAMMTGQSKLAISHIRAMVQKLPVDFLKEYAALAEGFAAMPLEVLVRFGRWDEILAEPNNFPDYMLFTRSFHHAARAVAYAAKKNGADARKEQAAYLETIKSIPAQESLGNNLASALIAVISPMVEGEILIREGKLDEGFSSLREAIKFEDALRYDEPPGWLIPVRHSLGAGLMKVGRFTEAEQVYREDLARLPENGWSLYGLSESLKRQGKNAEEIADLAARFKKIWAKGDLTLTTTCLCQAD